MLFIGMKIGQPSVPVFFSVFNVRTIESNEIVKKMISRGSTYNFLPNDVAVQPRVLMMGDIWLPYTHIVVAATEYEFR